MGKNKQNQQQKGRLSVQKRSELNSLAHMVKNLGFKQAVTPNELWTNYEELQGLLERVQGIESALKIKIPGGQKSRKANVDAMTKWAKENGAKFDGIKISEFPGFELGLEATKDLKQSSLLIQVPRNMIMSEENISAEVCAAFESIPLFEMDNIRLSIALIWEKINQNSFWKPYIDILPERYNTILYYGINEMQELKGSNSFGSALYRCICIARQYAVIYQFLQSSNNPTLYQMKEKFTYDMYRWAVSTIMTRCNSVPRSINLKNDDEEQDDGTIAALIPFWDMTNNKEGIVTTSYNCELNQIESTALSDYSKGEQVFMYYGPRTNYELLSNNGFIMQENKNDYICIRLGLSSSDELHDKRAQLLEMLNIKKNCEVKVMPSPDFISPELLAFVRVFNMGNDQLDHWINSDRAYDLQHIDCALETSLETKTWLFLQTRLSLLLRIFPTTLEEDEVTLANHMKGVSKLGHIKSMILKFRISEKRTLENALDYVKQRSKA